MIVRKKNGDPQFPIRAGDACPEKLLYDATFTEEGWGRAVCVDK
jgi:hypothetical protein